MGIKVFHIDSRFAPFWQSYKPALNRFLLNKRLPTLMASGENLMRMKPKQARQMIKQGSEPALIEHFQISIFIQKQGCSNATVLQMVNNFIRAANHQPSAQQDGTQFKGADDESDPVL